MTNSCEEDVAEEHGDESVSEEEDSFFHWEEESTLFSDLMDDNPYESDDGKLGALVDSLRAPFDEQGVQLKKEIAEAFVPTVNHVKARYEELHEQVDVPFGKGLFLFNKACKDMELAALKEQDELKSAHIASQKRIDELFKQLKEEYARRDQLWIDFEQELNELVEPVLETIQETPAKIERTIANFEKQSKTLEEEAKPVLDEKKLKELLKKLG
ncbi:hypothetical protein BDQ12DRAFT_676038 [Crucibulum laeve]|uniref:Uncharacterized protein n=1 Tax=Crucibulum laeve TaxID=68775 RepID=A0A5C3MC73_9AGAR|nr:hypothetical protein BDQ12DRAFT_676038 [Crucibulum laeve]